MSEFDNLPQSQGGHLKDESDEAILNHIKKIKTELNELELRIKVKYGIQAQDGCKCGQEPVRDS